MFSRQIRKRGFTFVVELGATIWKVGVACIANAAHAFVSMAADKALGMLADTGIGSPISHRASTVGLIHHIPMNSGAATVRYADSIPQLRGVVRECTNVAFTMVVDKFEVKTSVTLHIKMTASGSTFTVVHSHHLWGSWIQTHSAAV